MEAKPQKVSVTRWYRFKLVQRMILSAFFVTLAAHLFFSYNFAICQVGTIRNFGLLMSLAWLRDMFEVGVLLTLLIELPRLLIGLIRPGLRKQHLADFVWMLLFLVIAVLVTMIFWEYRNLVCFVPGIR